MNIDTGVTSFSHSTYDIHLMMMWICVVIGITVYCAMIYSFIYHRKSNRERATGIHVSTNTEIFWVLVSFLILTALALPALQNLLNMKDTIRPELSIATQPTELINLNKL